MSVNSFIPVLWSGGLIMALEKLSVFVGALTNRNYEGEIRNGGDSVTINSFGDIDIGTYTGVDITWQDIDTTDQKLLIDQEKYFAFKIDDVDAAQVKNAGSLRNAAMRRSAYKLRDTVDQFIAAKYGDAGLTASSTGLSLGTSTTAISITADGGGTSTKASEYLSLIQRAFMENNVPEDMLNLVIPPWFHQKCLLEKLTGINDTVNDDVYANGRIGRVLGLNLFVSNNVSNASSKYRIMGGSTDSITYADQISKIEAVRLENSFKDGVKGLHVYGAKTVRSDELLLAYASEGAEGQ